ncbi:MAG: hypothetical protein ACPGTQ_15940 [Colwellia sp.]
MQRFSTKRYIRLRKTRGRSRNVLHNGFQGMVLDHYTVVDLRVDKKNPFAKFQHK